MLFDSKSRHNLFLPEVIKLSTVDRPEMLFIEEHHQYFRISPELLLQSPKCGLHFSSPNYPQTFIQPGISNACWICFCQSRSTNISIGFVSLGLENQKKFVPLFYWPAFTFPRPGFSSLTKHVPCGPKQILTWVYFDSAWFLKISILSATKILHRTTE